LPLGAIHALEDRSPAASFAILSAVHGICSEQHAPAISFCSCRTITRRIVTSETAPTMAEVRDKGVNLKNPHSLFPTFTMATDRPWRPGISRRYRNLQQHDLYRLSIRAAGDTVVPFIENDAVLGDVDEHFGGDYLNEETTEDGRGRASARGDRKVGPTLLFDHTDRATSRPAFDRDRRFPPGGKTGVPLQMK